MLFEIFACSRSRIAPAPCSQVTLEDPEINLVSDPDGPWNFENPETENSKNTFPLARFEGAKSKDGKLSFPFHIGRTIDNPVFAKGLNVQKAK